MHPSRMVAAVADAARIGKLCAPVATPGHSLGLLLVDTYARESEAEAI